ncbi:hypothetical protein V6Z11_D12G089800 [Gossypium hirsutum]
MCQQNSKDSRSVHRRKVVAVESRWMLESRASSYSKYSPKTEVGHLNSQDEEFNMKGSKEFAKEAAIRVIVHIVNIFG